MEQEAIRIAGKNRPRTNRERLTGSERAVKAGISRSVRIMQTDHGGDTAQGYIYQIPGPLGIGIFRPEPARRPACLQQRFDGRQLRYDSCSGDSAPQGVTMSKTENFSRRQFVSSAVTAATISCLQPGRELFAALSAVERGKSELAHQSQVTLTTTPPWRDQGILNLAKSPYAKLRNVPVHAVTIEHGFWAQRRQVNVKQRIPSMEKLLEANGRMDNFRRLIGKSTAAQRGPV